jgi:hypothetical protein
MLVLHKILGSFLLNTGQVTSQERFKFMELIRSLVTWIDHVMLVHNPFN